MPEYIKKDIFLSFSYLDLSNFSKPNFQPPSFPYTLDHKIFHDCMIPPCPTKVIPSSRFIHSLKYFFQSLQYCKHCSPLARKYHIQYFSPLCEKSHKIFFPLVRKYPKQAYPGLWELPLVMWNDHRDGRCSMADACSNPPDAEVSS